MFIYVIRDALVRGTCFAFAHVTRVSVLVRSKENEGATENTDP